ncbi:MAG: hypothetical protein HYR84_16425 [Planctomycetes bacterium]|nr:hypothetical protein [Planctomycetota bacterium]
MSAELRFVCPKCRAVMSAPVEKAGEKINCLKCGQRLQIPPAQHAKTILASAFESENEPKLGSNPVAPIAPGPPPPSTAVGAESTSVAPNTPADEIWSRARAFLTMAFHSDWRRLPTAPILWPCFFLFFLPWINISCMAVDGKSVVLASQSGLQTCYGGASLDQKLERMAAREGRDKPENPEDQPPWSLLSILYGLFIILGGFLGLACIVTLFWQKIPLACPISHLGSLAFGSLAFLILLLQMVIHFPIERQFDKKRGDERDQKARKDALQREIRTLENRGFPDQKPDLKDDGGPAFAQQEMRWQQREATLAQKRAEWDRLNDRNEFGDFDALIEVRYSFSLWLSLFISFLTIPALLFEAGLFIYQILARKDELELRESGAMPAPPTGS